MPNRNERVLGTRPEEAKRPTRQQHGSPVTPPTCNVMWAVPRPFQPPLRDHHQTVPKVPVKTPSLSPLRVQGTTGGEGTFRGLYALPLQSIHPSPSHHACPSLSAQLSFSHTCRLIRLFPSSSPNHTVNSFPISTISSEPWCCCR